jgi:hypothetical protein
MTRPCCNTADGILDCEIVGDPPLPAYMKCGCSCHNDESDTPRCDDAFPMCVVCGKDRCWDWYDLRPECRDESHAVCWSCSRLPPEDSEADRAADAALRRYKERIEEV